MRFMDKVASYLDAYATGENKDGILKTAAEDNVSADDLVAYHNLTEGNIFTGKNIIETGNNPAESDSKIIQLGFTIDKVASEGLDENIIYQTAATLGMDDEDVAFLYGNIQKQAEEAGVAPQASVDDETANRIGAAINLLKEAGLNPQPAIELALNVNEDGQFTDEKIAEEAAQLTEEDFDKIAEAMEMIGEITPEVADMIISLSNN